jgi:hypothetical protein
MYFYVYRLTHLLAEASVLKIGTYVYSHSSDSLFAVPLCNHRHNTPTVTLSYCINIRLLCKLLHVSTLPGHHQENLS